MTKENKEVIQYMSAVCMLAFGVALSVAGFVVAPLGRIDDSILWCLGQTIIYAGSVFGIGVYVDTKIYNEFKKLKSKNGNIE